MKSTTITADSLIDDVLKDHPNTGALLIQGGRLSHAPKGHLYLEYPPLTVGEYAAMNRLDLAEVLRALQAAAEAQEEAKSFEAPLPSDPVRRGAAIGYTCAYRDPGNLDVRGVVAAQTERGPV